MQDATGEQVWSGGPRYDAAVVLRSAVVDTVAVMSRGLALFSGSG